MPKSKGASGSLLGRAIDTDVDSLKVTEKGKAVDTESSKTVSTEEAKPEPVSLTIKVPPSYRRHWQVEAKRRGTTVTSLIVEALRDKLGLPES